MVLRDDVVMNQQPQIIKKHCTEEFYKKRLRDKKNYYHSLIQEKVSARLLDAEPSEPSGVDFKEAESSYGQEQTKRSTHTGKFINEE